MSCPREQNGESIWYYSDINGLNIEGLLAIIACIHSQTIFRQTYFQFLSLMYSVKGFTWQISAVSSWTFPIKLTSTKSKLN